MKLKLKSQFELKVLFFARLKNHTELLRYIIFIKFEHIIKGMVYKLEIKSHYFTNNILKA